jgi:hypothetical protein
MQLRFQYYEEKRELKLKALENVISKSHMMNRTGPMNHEARQVVALLDDMKANKHLFDSNRRSNTSPKKSPMAKKDEVWPF